MSLLNLNTLNPVSLATLATPAGPAGLLATNLMTAVGQKIIGDIASRMHFSRGLSEMAQAHVALQMGDPKGALQDLRQAQHAFAQAHRASHTEQGDQERQLQDIIKKIVDDTSQSEDMKRAKGGGGKGANGAGGSGGQSWLMAIAQVLGDKLNSMAHELTGLAQQAADDPSASTMFGAKSQEFGILMNSANTGLKSIGDGLQTMAKRN